MIFNRIFDCKDIEIRFIDLRKTRIKRGGFTGTRWSRDQQNAMRPADQLAELKRIVGLDFTELDAKRAKLYEERTQVGRRATDAEARINTYPTSCASAPDVEISIATLIAEKDLADFAANRKVPILPCNLCGSLPNAQRQQMKGLLSRMEAEHPNLRQTMLAALGNVNLSHLLDREAFNSAVTRR